MKAVVAHSGGMDSSICLKLAIDAWGADNVLSLGFHYGQRHSTEHTAAQKIATAWGVKREVIDIPVLAKAGGNALVDMEIAIDGVNTAVPGRNGLIAWHTALMAHGLGAHEIYLGIIAVETHYRDCSREYIDKVEEILRWDLNDPHFHIRTPLVGMTKKETLALADTLQVLPFLLEETVTCYEGMKRRGCGKCPACLLRNQSLDDYRGSHS